MEITLKNNDASAVIKTAGAELKSCIAGGKEIMWCADPKFWGKTSPLLFPVVGRLKDRKTIIDGTEYYIGKHGFARDMEFEAEKTSDNTATFTLKSTQETLRAFPFEFTLKLHYRLLENGIEISYEVRNDSGQEMYYCIGAHPAIACGNIEDYKLVFEQPETVESPVLNSAGNFKTGVRVKRLENEREFPLKYSDFDNDCVYFNTIKSKSVTLLNGENHGVKISFEGFETLGVWTPSAKKAPFICIEPWCGCDDYENSDGIFSEKPGIQKLSPGNSRFYKMTIERMRVNG